MDIYMIVLAGGKGTRMKTDTPKCLYPFHYKPMINYLINAAKKIQIKELGLIIGYQQNLIKKAIKEEVTYIYQEEPLGTGHAIKIAKEFYNNKQGLLIIIPSDMPLINDEILNTLIDTHISNHNDLTLISNIVENPYGYGRIIRDKNTNQVIDIIEEIESSKEIKKIKEINTGIYIMDIEILKNNIDKIKNNNSKKEYYLTDLIKLLSKQYKINTLTYFDNYRLTGVNDLNQLTELENKYQQEINKKLMLSGVHLIKPESIIIEDTVTIGQNVTIDAYSIIRGNTQIYNNIYIKPYTYIYNNKNITN